MEQLNAFEAKQYSPLMLAYIGDAVVEMRVREKLLAEGFRQMKKVHKEATSYVCASSQARAMYRLREVLSSQEEAIYKRGRNARIGHARKNADPIEYKMATGFEALVGYLHLIQDDKRLDQIFEILYEVVQKGEKE